MQTSLSQQLAGDCRKGLVEYEESSSSQEDSENANPNLKVARLDQKQNTRSGPTLIGQPLSILKNKPHKDVTFSTEPSTMDLSAPTIKPLPQPLADVYEESESSSTDKSRITEVSANEVDRKLGELFGSLADLRSVTSQMHKVIKENEHIKAKESHVKLPSVDAPAETKENYLDPYLMRPLIKLEPLDFYLSRKTPAENQQ